MKFGKSIRAEARNNRGLSFINFKHLKRVLKRCVAAASSGQWVAAKDFDIQFREVLESEMQKVGDSFWKELHEISTLQKTLQEKLPYLDLQPDPETYTHMSFEELQAHLQSLGGLSEVPSTTEPSSSVRTSVALCDFCVNLGKISARSKRLRRGVLWNAVAVVKILKKRQKSLLEDVLGRISDWKETSAQVLSRQDWYRCPELSRLVSIVETTTDELMQRLTRCPPSRERYQCPICLDVILDPVCLRTCGHRFCWACLCMAYCEKPEGTLERCPSCRAVFPLDPEAFEIDGILSRFLRTFFPDLQSKRVAEQRESIRLRLANLHPEPAHTLSSVEVSQPGSSLSRMDTPQQTVSSENDNKRVESQHHCCPDCTDVALLFGSMNNQGGLNSTDNSVFALHNRDDAQKMERRFSAGCKHVQNVRLGLPADVDRLAFSPTFASDPMKKCGLRAQHGHEDTSEATTRYHSAAVLSDFDEHTAVVDRMVESLLVESPLQLTTLSGTANSPFREEQDSATSVRSALADSPSKPAPKLISMMRNHLELGSEEFASLTPATSTLRPSDPVNAFWGLMFGGQCEKEGTYDQARQQPLVSSLSQQYHDPHVALVEQSQQAVTSLDLEVCDLPDIVGKHSPRLRHLNSISCDPTPPFSSYYEAVDDEDDEIEAEFLKQYSSPPHQQKRSVLSSLSVSTLYSTLTPMSDRITVL